MKTENILNGIGFGILAFWTLWFTLVTLADIVDLLQILKLVSKDFAFNSSNHKLVLQMLSVFQLESFVIYTYSFVIFSAACIAALFWYALLSQEQAMIYAAFALSLLLTAIFIIGDEIFIQYEFEHSHFNRLSLQTISFILFYLLDRRKT